MCLIPHLYSENHHISFPKMEIFPRAFKVTVKAQVPWLEKVAVSRGQALPTQFPSPRQPTSFTIFFLSSGSPEAAGQAV